MVFDSSSEFVNDDRTDEDGYFVVDGLSGGVYFATAVDNFYFRQLYNGIDCSGECDPTTGTGIAAAEGEQVVGIDFALVKGGSISGSVTAAGTVRLSETYWSKFGMAPVRSYGASTRA